MQQAHDTLYLGVSLFGKHSVKILPVQLRLFRNRCHASLRFGDIAESQKKKRLVALFHSCIEVGRSLAEIFERLEEVFLICRDFLVTSSSQPNFPSVGHIEMDVSG